MLAGNRQWLDEDDSDRKTREVRLGLVLYGGISLAIYINGVTQEFFRAVHGSGVYRLLKAITDSDIIVDVISGTSAGGMNGVLLAYALCNNKNFADASDLWRAYGGITKLLHSPQQTTPPPASLFKSEDYYQIQLQDAFAKMTPYIPEPNEDCSAFDELDLFVTGTDVDGNISTQYDDAGHMIDVKDHRSVFLLKHRRGRKEPFNDNVPSPRTTYKALGKLAYITSCFPGAFTPVHVTHAASDDQSVDGRLQLWGQLDKDAYFLDGGILDNKPFTYTTKAIFSRNADRDVDRKLFYVEPSPESFHKPQQASSPNFLQALLASLIGIPGYESIADDLKLLAEHNSKLTQYQRLVADLQPPGLAATTEGATSAPTSAVYRRSRLVFISERVLQGLFKTGDSNNRVSPADRQQLAQLVKEFDTQVGDSSSPVVDQVFCDFDVYFRLRRMTRVVYLIFDLLYRQESIDSSGQAAHYRELWRALNQEIELLEIVRAAMESLIDAASLNWRTLPPDQLWPTVRAALYRLLDAAAVPAQPLRDNAASTELWPQQALPRVHDELKRLAATIADDIGHARLDSAMAAPAHTLLHILDQHEQNLLASYVPDINDPVRLAYDRFAELDAQLFPLELVGDLHEKDIIELIRISPQDAQKGFSRNSLSDKLSGDTLYHFGAFFKQSWRSNDILWGRLDGLCQLVEALMNRDRLQKIIADDAWCARVRARFFSPDPQDASVTRWNPAMDPAVLFPNAGAPTHNRCRAWLEQLLAEDAPTRQKALNDQFDQMLELIIEAAQLEVLNQELPNVINAAITEQSEWNQYLVRADATKQRAGAQAQIPAKTLVVEYGQVPWAFTNKQLDPYVAIVAAAEMTKTAMDHISVSVGGAEPARPIESRLGAYFRSSYRVGAEELTKDIPTLVLLEILATTLLVLRNCILALFGAKADQIRRNPFYFFGLSLPLTAFYALVRVSRRAPAWGNGLLIGLIVIPVLALVVGCVWSKQLIMPAGDISFIGLAVFILAPLATLLAVFLFLYWSRRWLR
ncbi:MAG: patatin-like protein [Roseiflexaceae bacterium]